MKHDSFPGAAGAYGFHNYVSVSASLGVRILTTMLQGHFAGVHSCNNLYRGSYRYPVQRSLGKIWISKTIPDPVGIDLCN